MSNVMELHGVCEARKCKRDERRIARKSDLVVVNKRKYHRGCEPTKEEQKARNRSSV